MSKKETSKTGISRRGLAGAATVALAPAQAMTAAAAAAQSTPVMTETGKVSGTVIEGVSGYLGIPYGAPPVGPLRFKPPLKPAPWKGVRDGSRYGFKPIQTLITGFSPEGMIRGGGGGRSAPLTRVPADPTDAPNVAQSEDCLYLDVWTRAPGAARKKPVMVWFHGGGFAFGAGSDPIYTGVNFVNAGDVVLVNVTHRLNVFGYLYLGELAGDAFATSGNAGMLDLVLALAWVRDNIAAFGGDPANVTIFGESGGGAKVSGLLAMPAAKGLFHKAIVMSGSANRMVEKADATNFARLLLAELGLAENQAAALQQVEARKLFDAAQAVTVKLGGGIFGGGRGGLSPVVDGVALPRHPFDPTGPALSADIPLMVGTTKDEAALMHRLNPALGAMTDQQMREQVRATAGPRADEALAIDEQLHPGDSPIHRLVNIQTSAGARANAYVMTERKVAQAKAPAWLYVFAWQAPGEGAVFRANHGLDVGLVFSNTHLSAWTGANPHAVAMQKVMTATWTAFAHHGQP
ncbi:MAG: carboxylesterase, partial [Phenylobacterium sp.]|nr:carboxylesterase [Phenylobacterium sp.]